MGRNGEDEMERREMKGGTDRKIDKRRDKQARREMKRNKRWSEIKRNKRWREIYGDR